MRRKAFVKAYTDPLSPTFGNQGKSAQSAGFAASTGNALLNDSQVQNMVRAALERHGIDEDFLAEGLKEGLRAEEVKLTSFDGKYTDEKRVPDWHARVRYQEMAHRLRGDYPKEEAPQQAVVVLHMPDSEPLIDGHEPECDCADCIAEYNRRVEVRLHGEREPDGDS